jgi:integrase
VGDLEKKMPDWCRAAGVPVTSHFHTTRHTFATVLLAAGEDLYWVSEQLGHKNIRTTEQVYRHWIRDARRDAERAARVAAAWAPRAGVQK